LFTFQLPDGALELLKSLTISFVFGNCSEFGLFHFRIIGVDGIVCESVAILAQASKLRVLSKTVWGGRHDLVRFFGKKG
jgi:hypothetical protein